MDTLACGIINYREQSLAERSCKKPCGEWTRAALNPATGVTVIWASPSHITLGPWVSVEVRVTGDAHITRLLGMGCPYHCDIGRDMYLPYRKASPKRSKETHS